MNKILSLTCAIGFVATPAAYAAVSDEDFQQLREQLAAVSQRLDELAAENAELRASQEQSVTAINDVQATVTKIEPSVAQVAVESWSDRVVLDGDFRYRYERIDLEGSDARSRNRIRARNRPIAYGKFAKGASSC